jgi:uncharacterized protein YlxW (UPF0749 family)
MVPTSHRKPASPPTPTGRRPDESMTLITSMMERPLDPGYAAAAERREQAGLPRATSLRSGTVLVVAVVTGLLLTLAALSLRVPQTEAVRIRNDLVAQIEARRAEADRQAAQIQALQREVNQLQAAQLGAGESELQQRLAALDLISGSSPVTGPGLRLTLDDAVDSGPADPNASPRDQGDINDKRVFAKDMQFVVNGLWQAGAEAIAVNGQRLTSRSAIRNAGDAILVNYRPLARPYVIEVIGDAGDLQVEFADNGGGAYTRALQDNYGIRVSMDEVSRLTLPGATSLSVRSATVPSASPSPSSSTTSPMSRSRPTGSTPSDQPTATETGP